MIGAGNRAKQVWLLHVSSIRWHVFSKEVIFYSFRRYRNTPVTANTSETIPLYHPCIRENGMEL